jgi:flagellar FliJ protein
MRRAERLDPVVQHVDKKQEKALQAVAFSQGQVAQEKTKLQQLLAYRTEYLNKQGHTEKSCLVIEMQEFNRFLMQLDDTIKKQLKVIQLRETELDARREIWQATRVDSKVMHKVVENLQQQEQIQQARDEQKTMDEFAQRKSLHS